MMKPDDPYAPFPSRPQGPLPGDSGGNDEKTASHFVRLRGLPYSAKEAEIRQFFEGLKVDEVQLIFNNDGRASGEAFVGFSTCSDAENGLLRDKNMIGQRYIEVFRIGEVEFNRIRQPRGLGYGGYSSGPTYGGKGGPGGPANVVRVRGLPYSCKREELIGFFGGLNVEEVVFGKEPGEGGRPTGEGYVKFRTIEDAESAMSLNGATLGKRYLELFRSDQSQFEHFKRQMNSSTAQPLNSIYPDPWAAGWYDDQYSGWEAGYGGGGVPRQQAPQSAPSGRGGSRGGFRGGRGGATGSGAGGPYRGYDAAPPRSNPYDYHGRMYGNDPSMGSYGGGGSYDPYGYPSSQSYGSGGGGNQIGYNKIFMRGLPFRVTPQQISDFFAPLNCVEIKLGYLPDNRASGDGIVEFATPEEAYEARTRDRKMIGNRYIEIFDSIVKSTPGTTYKAVGGTGATRVPYGAPASHW